MDSLTSTLIIAGFSLIGTLAGTWGGIRASNKLINYQVKEMKNDISEIKKKVDSHNNFDTRLAQQETTCRLVTHEHKDFLRKLEKKIDNIMEAI